MLPDEVQTLLPSPVRAFLPDRTSSNLLGRVESGLPQPGASFAQKPNLSLPSIKKKEKKGKPDHVSNSINLRKEFEEILDQHGHWVVLRRRIGNRKTTGFNPSTHEDEDPKNMGSGHAYYDQFVRARKQTFFSISEDPGPLGRASVPILIFWVKHNVKPSRGDFFIELAQDEASLERNFRIQPIQPYEIVRKYDIQDVDDMRDYGGRTEFFRCVVEEADLGDES